MGKENGARNPYSPSPEGAGYVVTEPGDAVEEAKSGAVSRAILQSDSDDLFATRATGRSESV